MPKSKPIKPPRASSAPTTRTSSKNSFSIPLAAAGLSVAVALGACIVCGVDFAGRLQEAPPEAPSAHEPNGWSEASAHRREASARLSATSPSEAIVGDACTYVRPLWASLGADDDSCATFLRDHWEQAPLLSRPGARWNRDLMTLGDVARMVGSWPIRFMKNHATAAMHKPNSGFVADMRWERGQEVPTDLGARVPPSLTVTLTRAHHQASLSPFQIRPQVPTDAVDIAMAEQLTLVMHNLEVYWPPVGALIREVVRFFHAYTQVNTSTALILTRTPNSHPHPNPDRFFHACTQVNLYISPPGLGVATAPHQDAHSVFIVQVR
jgi:hypothetical protein